MRTALIAIVLCSLLTGIPGCGGSDQSNTPLAYLPGDISGLGYVDFKQVVDAGLVDTFLEDAQQPAEEGGESAVAVLNRMNLDLKKDVDALGFALCGEGDEAKPLVVVSGRFDGDAIYKEALADEENPSEKVDYKGYSLLKNDDGVVGVLNGTLIVFSSEEALVHQVIDIHKGDAKGSALNSPHMKRSRSMHGKTFWFTSDVDVRPGDEPPNPMMPGLDPSKITMVDACGDLTDRATAVNAVITCEDNESAAAMATGLQQGANMLQMFGLMAMGGDPEGTKAFSEIVQGIRITSDASKATVDLTITAEQISKIKAAAERIKAKREEAAAGAPPEFPEEEEKSTETKP